MHRLLFTGFGCIVSAELVLGIHLKDNLTDNTDVTAWSKWVGQCQFTPKSYWSSQE